MISCHVVWGSLGEWFGGLVTAAAVYIAYRGLRAEARARNAGDVERQAQRAREEKRFAAQLRCGAGKSYIGGAPDGRPYDWAWRIHNVSSEPFFDVDVVATMPRGQEFTLPRINLVPADDDQQYNVTQNSYMQGDPFPSVLTDYTDFVGLRWRRQSDGRLERLPSG